MTDTPLYWSINGVVRADGSAVSPAEMWERLLEARAALAQSKARIRELETNAEIAAANEKEHLAALIKGAWNAAGLQEKLDVAEARLAAVRALCDEGNKWQHWKNERPYVAVSRVLAALDTEGEPVDLKIRPGARLYRWQDGQLVDNDGNPAPDEVIQLATHEDWDALNDEMNEVDP